MSYLIGIGALVWLLTRFGLDSTLAIEITIGLVVVSAVARVLLPVVRALTEHAGPGAGRNTRGEQAAAPPSRPPDREFHSSVAGVTQGRRQDVIARQVMAGDRLLLVPEPDNPVDEDAIALCTAAGNQIGYLPAGVAADVHQWTGEGAFMTVHAAEVTGGTPSKPIRGVNLIVRVWWD